MYSIHSGLVLSRPDTRNLTRTWAVEHIPAGAKIVLEPVVPNAWLDETRGETAHPRWIKFPALRVVLNPATGKPETANRTVELEDYERTLGPALVSYYERHGYCWVISGYTQSGRAFADPRSFPTRSPTTGNWPGRAKSSTTYSPTTLLGKTTWPSTSTGRSTTTRSPSTVPARK